MNLLVTGGAGYIGSICVEKLVGLNYQVVVVDNLKVGYRAAVNHEAIFYEGNFGDRNLLEKIFRTHNIEVVLHFAADTKVNDSMINPAQFFHNNLVNGITLIDVMLKFDCRRIIFSSTAAIFGEPLYVPIDEKHSLSPINPYGESKLMFEKILDWYHKAYGLKYNSLRYFNAAGASELLGNANPDVSLLIPVIIKVLLCKHKKLKIFGNDYPTKDGTCIRDYIHVLDLAQAHILALEQLEVNPNSKYNLGNGKGFSNLEVVKTLETVTGEKIPYEFAARRLGDPSVIVASSDLAKQELGWNPQYSNLEQIVDSAWKWHKTHHNGYN